MWENDCALVGSHFESPLVEKNALTHVVVEEIEALLVERVHLAEPAEPVHDELEALQECILVCYGICGLAE